MLALHGYALDKARLSLWNNERKKTVATWLPWATCSVVVSQSPPRAYVRVVLPPFMTLSSVTMTQYRFDSDSNSTLDRYRSASADSLGLFFSTTTQRTRKSCCCCCCCCSQPLSLPSVYTLTRTLPNMQTRSVLWVLCLFFLSLASTGSASKPVAKALDSRVDAAHLRASSEMVDARVDLETINSKTDSAHRVLDEETAASKKKGFPRLDVIIPSITVGLFAMCLFGVVCYLPRVEGHHGG
jgi:hypothetical protein